MKSEKGKNKSEECKQKIRPCGSDYLVWWDGGNGILTGLLCLVGVCE